MLPKPLYLFHKLFVLEQSRVADPRGLVSADLRRDQFGLEVSENNQRRLLLYVLLGCG